MIFLYFTKRYLSVLYRRGMDMGDTYGMEYTRPMGKPVRPHDALFDIAKNSNLP